MNAQTEIKPANKSLAVALASAQMEMEGAKKSSQNPHFRSKYADLASVMDACMPALNAHGIAVIQPTGEDDTGRYVETILIHGESGDSLSCRVPLIVGKNDMQGYGSAVTYARRYGLMSMAGIAPEDDDGNAAAKSPPNEAQNQPPREAVSAAESSLKGAKDLDALKAIWSDLPKGIQSMPKVVAAKDARKAELEAAVKSAGEALEDEIPY